jgi:deoxyribodipyrimidine photo-lyase
MPNTSVNIFWFRRDLRLHDNCGFFHALKKGGNVLPIFIFDTEILSKLENKKDARVEFIHTQLLKLKGEFEKHDSSLKIIYGNPEASFKRLIDKYKITAVYTNRDYEPYAKERDVKISELLSENGIAFHTFKDHVIFEKDEVMKPDGKPYTVFTPYSVRWKAALENNPIEHYPSENLLDRLFKTPPFHKPSLEEITFSKSGIEVPPPRLNEELLKNYHNTRNIPSLAGTSNLSVHLRFGTVSVREMVVLAKQHNEQFLNELIWREFFQTILWHFPQVVNTAFKNDYDAIKWSNNEDHFHAWCQGKTGYPMVDAGMRELNATGLMHNRVRMVVASFLTKHLLIDWRWGEAYFAEKLLDFELAANNGNWQWAAGCGCDAAPYFRVFNPTEQQKKFDPDFKYIKKWIPEFGTANYPKPIVDHVFARNRVLQAYKVALNREEVLT